MHKNMLEYAKNLHEKIKNTFFVSLKIKNVQKKSPCENVCMCCV